MQSAYVRAMEVWCVRGRHPQKVLLTFHSTYHTLLPSKPFATLPLLMGKTLSLVIATIGTCSA